MRILPSLAAALLLAACGTSTPSGGPAPGPEAAPFPAPLEAGSAAGSGGSALPAGPLSPGDVWRVDPQDTIVHVQSGAVCPSSLGGLRRDKQTIYRANGTDVGCAYVSQDGRSALRFFVFLSEAGGLDAEMRIAADSIRAQQPIARRASVAPQAQGYQSFAVVQAELDGGATRNTLLMTQVNDGWLLKVRITCPEPDARRLEEIAGRLLGETVERLMARPAPAPLRQPG